MITTFRFPKFLVAPVAYVATGHLHVRSSALRARLRLGPALPAHRFAKGRLLSAGATGVHPKSNRNTFCGVMFREMLALRLDELQVGGVVVEPVSIPVVDHFGSEKVAADHALHHKTVLHHPSILRSVGMGWLVDHAVRHSSERHIFARAMFRCLIGGHSLSSLDVDGMATRRTARLPDLRRPAVDEGSTPMAWVHVLRSWFHGSTSILKIPWDKEERNNNLTAEYLTLNRPPAWVPGVQETLPWTRP